VFPVFARFRFLCIRGAAAFAACMASSISLACNARLGVLRAPSPCKGSSQRGPAVRRVVRAGYCASRQWWIGVRRGCVLVVGAYVPASVRMRARARGSRATAGRVAGVGLRAGLTGRNRKGGVGVSRDFARHQFISLEGDDAVGGGAFGFWGLVRFRSSRVSGSCAFAALLRLRPVRPARSAWHEMPGSSFSAPSRPARAALSEDLPCDGWYARDIARRGNGGLVCAGGACWLSGHTFRRRCECEPEPGDHVHP
jgi:hypothetical protein